MDINSIGSMTRLPGISPTPPEQGSGSTPGAARENFAAAGNTQSAQQAAAPNQPKPANTADSQNDARQDQRQNLQSSIDALNEFIKPQNTSLEFSIDDESGTVVVKVTDKETKEVIKQFPSEEALELAKALDKLKGLLVQQKV